MTTETPHTVWDRTGNSWCLIREDLWCHAGTDEATYRELPFAQLEDQHGPLKTIDGQPVTAAAVDTTETQAVCRMHREPVAFTLSRPSARPGEIVEHHYCLPCALDAARMWLVDGVAVAIRPTED